jgi:hypothetical protein
MLSGQFHALAALFLGTGPSVPIGCEARLAPVVVWMLWSREQSLAPDGNWTRATELLTYHYTDWGIPAHFISSEIISPWLFLGLGGGGGGGGLQWDLKNINPTMQRQQNTSKCNTNKSCQIMPKSFNLQLHNNFHWLKVQHKLRLSSFI